MAHWPRNDNITVQGLLVFAVPSTKVCSNIYHLVPQNFRRRLHRHRNHHTLETPPYGHGSVTRSKLTRFAFLLHPRLHPSSSFLSTPYFATAHRTRLPHSPLTR